MNTVGRISGNISGASHMSGNTSSNRSMSGGISVPTSSHYVLPPATTSELGGIIVGDDLLITAEGRLSIDKANSVSEDNTKPITAAAVYTEVGNINALLATI